MGLVAVIALSGCASTVTNNPCPQSRYLSCSTVCELEAKNISDGALNDMLTVTGVMIKLQEGTARRECECGN